MLPELRLQLPIPLADGIRLGISVLLFISLLLLVGPNSLVGRTFSGDCTWAAITAAVISAPLVGKTAQTGFQRIVGTILGRPFTPRTGQ